MLAYFPFVVIVEEALLSVRPEEVPYKCLVVAYSTLHLGTETEKWTTVSLSPDQNDRSFSKLTEHFVFARERPTYLSCHLLPTVHRLSLLYFAICKQDIVTHNVRSIWYKITVQCGRNFD